MLADFQCNSSSKDKGSAVIHRGPVKSADRIQPKAETDYCKVVDLLRGSSASDGFTIKNKQQSFSRIEDLNAAFQHLFAEIESDNKECQMKGIIRIKNGYKEMKIDEPKYGDIKLNAIFEDQQTSIICEI